MHLESETDYYHYVFTLISSTMWTSFDFMERLEMKGHNSRLATTTKIKHLLLSVSIGASYVSPVVSGVLVTLTVILIVTWSTLKRHHVALQSRRPANQLEEYLDQVYVCLKSRLLKDEENFPSKVREQPEEGNHSTRPKVDAEDSGVEDDVEREEGTSTEEGGETDTTASETETGSAAAQTPESTDFCGQDVMRMLHAKEMRRIFEKVATRMLSRQPLFRLLPEAEVQRIVADHVTKTEALASEWMQLWQQGAHRRLALSDIWRLLLDVQEHSLQQRLLQLLPRQP